MKKLKMVSILCAFCLCMSTFAACNDRENPGETGNQVTIVIPDAIQDAIGINKFLSDRQKAFDDTHPEINVVHRTVESDSFNQVRDIMDQLSAQNDRTPTVLMVNSNEFARQLASDGFIGDFLPYLEGWEDFSDMREDIVEGYMMDGKLIGFPTAMEMPLLGFNKEILEKNKAALSAIGENEKTNTKLGRNFYKQQFK